MDGSQGGNPDAALRAYERYYAQHEGFHRMPVPLSPGDSSLSVDVNSPLPPKHMFEEGAHAMDAPHSIFNVGKSGAGENLTGGSVRPNAREHMLQNADERTQVEYRAGDARAQAE